MMTKIAMMRKKMRKPSWMKMFAKSVGEVSSVGREGKVLTEPRRLAWGSSVNVEDWLNVTESRLEWLWMEFVEDKVGVSVELEDK